MLTTGAAFVAPAVAGEGALALRGAVAPPAAPPALAATPSSASSSAAPWLLGAAVVAAAVPASRRPARAARKALPDAAVAVAALEVEEEAPPPPFDPAGELGVTAPLGYFDPLGFCKVGDYPTFHKLRSSELKHGRVAMMAAVGTVFQHFVKFPGFEKTPAGLAALTDPVGFCGFFGLFTVAGVTEQIYWKDNLNKEPGNFGDPGNWKSGLPMGIGGYSDELRDKEINNGRMAMISIMGIIVAELATGKDGIEQFGL
jgi:hypothetical protein